MRRVEDDRPSAIVKQEPSDDDQLPVADAIQTTDSKNVVDHAVATLPHFNSLKYDTNLDDSAGRGARPDAPLLEEGDDDPNHDHNS